MTQKAIRQLTLIEWKAYGHDLIDALVSQGPPRGKVYIWLQKKLGPKQSAHFHEMLTIEECKRAVLILEGRVKKVNKKKKAKEKLRDEILPRAERLKAMEALKTYVPPKKSWWRRFLIYLSNL